LIHVADLCDAIQRIATNGARVPNDSKGDSNRWRGVYYIAAERDVTYGELGRLAARAAGWKVAATPAPRAIFWMAGAVGEAIGRIRRRPTIINFDKIREAMAPGWICSGDKIRRELGFQTMRPLEVRFEETVAWYREHGWL
jgi:nucleoside-diphosphate-sugar epimerase